MQRCATVNLLPPTAVKTTPLHIRCCVTSIQPLSPRFRGSAFIRQCISYNNRISRASMSPSSSLTNCIRCVGHLGMFHMKLLKGRLGKSSHQKCRPQKLNSPIPSTAALGEIQPGSSTLQHSPPMFLQNRSLLLTNTLSREIEMLNIEAISRLPEVGF